MNTELQDAYDYEDAYERALITALGKGPVSVMVFEGLEPHGYADYISINIAGYTMEMPGLPCVVTVVEKVMADPKAVAAVDTPIAEYYRQKYGDRA